jgi:hypothetical protein
MQRLGTVGLALLVAVLVTQGGAVAQEGAAADASSLLTPGMLGWQEGAAPAPAGGGAALSDFVTGTNISGYVDTGFTFNFNDTNDGGSVGATTAGGVENPGRIFDTRSNELMLNSFALDFERKTSGQELFGYRATVIMGDDASVVNNAAPEGSSGADVFGDEDFTLTNANVQFQFPDDSPLKDTVVKVGRFETEHGAEVIHSPRNDGLNYSRSLLFGYAIPYTHVGAMVHRGNLVPRGEAGELVGVHAGWVNGWDVINDNNDSGSMMAGVTISPTDFFSLDIDTMWGSEQTETGADNHANSDKRTLVDVVGKLTPAGLVGDGMEFLNDLTLIVNVDWGGEEGVEAAPGPGAEFISWYGVATYVVYDFEVDAIPGGNERDKRFFISVRGEWFEDPSGVRTSGVGGIAANDHANMYEITGTLGFRPHKIFLVRLEVRYDHAELGGVGGAANEAFDDGERHHQTTVGVNFVANL